MFTLIAYDVESAQWNDVLQWRRSQPALATCALHIARQVHGGKQAAGSGPNGVRLSSEGGRLGRYLHHGVGLLECYVRSSGQGSVAASPCNSFCAGTCAPRRARPQQCRHCWWWWEWAWWHPSCARICSRRGFVATVICWCRRLWAGRRPGRGTVRWEWSYLQSKLRRKGKQQFGEYVRISASGTLPAASACPGGVSPRTVGLRRRGHGSRIRYRYFCHSLVLCDLWFALCFWLICWAFEAQGEWVALGWIMNWRGCVSLSCLD